MSLVVEDLSCRRDGRLVFAGLGFALAPGEVRLVLGPNGVGKSSLLRVLAGLLPPAGGRIAFDGTGPEDGDAWAERIAYAGHLDAVKPQLTLGENLAFWADLLGAPPGRAAAAAAAFDLGPILGRGAHAASAGQRRRAGLARLLLADRPLWLVDEPTVALDTASVARFLAALAAHLGRGGMALVATHGPLEITAGPPLRLAPQDPDRAAAGDPFLAGAIA